MEGIDMMIVFAESWQQMVKFSFSVALNDLFTQVSRPKRFEASNAIKLHPMHRGHYSQRQYRHGRVSFPMHPLKSFPRTMPK